VAPERVADPLGELGDQAPGIAVGGEARYPDQRLAHDVRDHQEGAGRAHVDRDHAAPARVQVEELRLAPAGRLSLGSLEHEAVANEVVHEHGHGAARRAHEAREVGSRDGLPGPDQVEGDLPVDLAGRAAAGQAERDRTRTGLVRPLLHVMYRFNRRV
jgi:hypothetical protein